MNFHEQQPGLFELIVCSVYYVLEFQLHRVSECNCNCLAMKRGQWTRRICSAWKERNVWWSDGCVGWVSRTEYEVRSYMGDWVCRAWQMMWGRVDRGGLDILNERTLTSGCMLADALTLQDQRTGQEQEDMGWVRQIEPAVFAPQGRVGTGQDWVEGHKWGGTFQPVPAWKNGR